MSAPAAPLDGLRVIDLTRVLSGPFCTMILADLGAEVIKVESPDGDPIRGQSEGDLRGYFAAFNRNKRSVTLDLYADADKARLERLLATADLLVENFRPGVLESMGLSSARLEAIRPGLITVSINGFGSSGPYADRPAFDFIAQAMSGFMSVTGTADTPLRAGPPIADLVAGLYAALGAVAAVRHRDKTGEGQAVEASMMGAMVSLLGYFGIAALESGRPPARLGNEHFVVAPYGMFEASDGWVAVAPSNEPILKRFFEAIDLGALLQKPEYASNAARIANRARLNDVINDRMRGAPREHWVRELNAAGVPCGRVQDLVELSADPQVRQQGWIVDQDDASGPLKAFGLPVRLSRTPWHLRRGAPELGEANEELLQ